MASEDVLETRGETRAMMRKSQDPRAERTRQSILDAVEQFNGLPGEDITVSTIARNAGISRSSFYTHFSSVDDLALTLLADATNEISGRDLSIRQTAGMTGADAARIALERIVLHFAGHRSLYRALFILPATSQSYNRAVELYALHAEETFALLPDLPATVDRSVAATYLAGGTLTVLRAWLGSEHPEDPARLVELLFALTPSWLASPS